MCTLYTFACSNASSDRDAYPMNASNFPSHYLWLLWSTRWTSNIWDGLGPLCDLMSRAITDPTSNYRPEDAILSVEHFVASIGVIGEAELRVFFGGLTYYEQWYSSFMDDPARRLFFASLTLKLCQRSNVSMPKIFSLLKEAYHHYQSFDVRGGLLCIFPLVCSLSLKTAPLTDNTAVHALETSFNNELSLELNLFVDAFCSELDAWSHQLDVDVSYGVVSVLSLIPALRESHQVAGRIIQRLPGDKEGWRIVFQYWDEHGESASLCLLINIHFRTYSGQSRPSKASSTDYSTE
jgi:hypothetical protein